jgi:hypothetical protein
MCQELNPRNEMKHQRHFESMTPGLRQVATVLGMIDDLDQAARLLDCEIAAQELNQQKTALALLASLTSRRDKLRETIAMLETSLADNRVSKTSSTQFCVL